MRLDELDHLYFVISLVYRRREYGSGIIGKRKWNRAAHRNNINIEPEFSEIGPNAFRDSMRVSFASGEEDADALWRRAWCVHFKIQRQVVRRTQWVEW